MAFKATVVRFVIMHSSSQDLDITVKLLKTGQHWDQKIWPV
jgi:hypothetical protein